MRSRKEKPIFRGLTIAVAGDLGGQWTDINIARWVELREGRFTRAMDESVTHLVCSNEEFRRKSSMGEFFLVLSLFLLIMHRVGCLVPAVPASISGLGAGMGS